MTVPDVKGQFYPTKEEAKTLYLNALAAGCERAGITINVLPGSLNDFKADAIASIAVPAYANNKLARQSLSPLEASDDQIIDVAAAYGVIPRDASPSQGFVAVSLSSGASSVIIPAGFQATASDGTKIETVAVATVADGDTLAVQASTGGASTNLAAGTQVQWDSASVAYLKRTATVAAGGLTLGRDADTAAVVRQRLLERLSSPGTGGNWAFVRSLAEGASASVSAAFVYPAIGGPGSYGVCVVSDETDRQVSASIINTVAATIVGTMPGHAYLNCTGTQTQYLDVILGLSIPSPTFGGGTGGGWRDASPWPSSGSGGIVKITSYDSSTGTITTDAVTAGTCAAGTHIGIWDYETETMHEFEVLTAVVTVNLKLTVVGGFPKDFSGRYISAGAENLTGYAATALEAFKALGPGEKSTNTAIIPRGARRPVPTSTEWPQYISSRFLETWLNNHDEIADVRIATDGGGNAASYETGTTTTRTTPSIPTSHLDPPYILCPKHLAFKPV